MALYLFELFGRTLLGLAVVFVFVGWVVPSLYLLAEGGLLWLLVGRSRIHANLRNLAREDFLLLISEQERDKGLTRPFAVLFALGTRGHSLREDIRILRNLKAEQEEILHRETVANLAEGWRAGLQSSVLLDHLSLLAHLRVPRPEREMLGSILSANLTYLLGDLRTGRRMADANMRRAEDLDKAGLLPASSLPRFQLLASYAYVNSRLFLGHFDEAARELGRRWRSQYADLSTERKTELMDFFRDTGLLNPVASMPRHLILASAFKGKAIIAAGWPDTKENSVPTIDLEDRWVMRWYTAGQELCHYEPSVPNQNISLHFTHAYMALYCTLVKAVHDPQEILACIESNTPIVSLYARHAVEGIYHFSRIVSKEGAGPDESEAKKALEHLRAADAYSRMSGNRFLEGIVVPVHSAAASIDRSRRPETRFLLARARRYARLSRSPFYDTLLLAAEAVIAYHERNRGRFERLRTKCQRRQRRRERLSQGLIAIYHLDELAAL